MLELSMYDDIPHLLAPVVTEPGKAIRALKWTVEQMEERYRMMANLGVRALPSFNAKVREAKAKGAKLGRRVQTGYDADSGQPIYETESLEYEVLPQIVVIIDELADLMMTAGKEVEFLDPAPRAKGARGRHPSDHGDPAARRSTSSPASSRPICRPASASR